MPRKDLNQIAFAVVQKALGVAPNGPPEKDAVAAESGRKGGLKGGVVRKQSLSPERRAEIARVAAKARWRK